jgi:nucleotidyltransferase substrate binding protein (TIGR01987 family)
MKTEVEYSLQKLNTGFARLKEAVEQAIDELDRDGVVQRFEFTFELFWKTAKVLLEYEGFRCAGPRSCIREGARRGFLTDGETILDMLEDRNKTTHIYDEITAGEIYDRIRDRYVSTIAGNIERFEKYLADWN